MHYPTDYKTKILIFFASFVKKRKKNTTANNCCKTLCPKDQKLTQFPITGERLFRIQPRYTVMLVSTYFLAGVLGEKSCIVKMIPVKTEANFFSVFLILFQFFLAYLDDNNG